MSVEATGIWIPLMDYSAKYDISLSTLRRRIDAEDINFRFEDGMYFIMDEPVGTHQRVHRPSQKSDLALVGAHQGMMKDNGTMSSSIKNEIDAQEQKAREALIRVHKDESILNAANKLLSELKNAYRLILQDKEDQILHLKQEVADLNTLVRVLESENERLKSVKSFY